MKTAGISFFLLFALVLAFAVTNTEANPQVCRSFSCGHCCCTDRTPCCDPSFRGSAVTLEVKEQEIEDEQDEIVLQYYVEDIRKKGKKTKGSAKKTRSTETYEEFEEDEVATQSGKTLFRRFFRKLFRAVKKVAKFLARGAKVVWKFLANTVTFKFIRRKTVPANGGGVVKFRNQNKCFTSCEYFFSEDIKVNKNFVNPYQVCTACKFDELVYDKQNGRCFKFPEDLGLFNNAQLQSFRTMCSNKGKCYCQNGKLAPQNMGIFSEINVLQAERVQQLPNSLPGGNHHSSGTIIRADTGPHGAAIR